MTAPTTSGKAQTPTTPDEREIASLRRQFNRVVRRAQAALVWERLWPRLVPPLSSGGLFMSASFFGLWHALPPGGRVAGVAGFALATALSPFAVKTKTLLVTRRDALRRLDENSGAPSRPAQMLCDTLAETVPADARDIWAMHLAQTWQEWGGKFQAGKPKPNMNTHDPYRLRYAVAASVAIGAMVAGHAGLNRLRDAFNWQTPPVPIMAKAWINPPENFQEKACYLTQDSQTNSKCPVAHKNSIMTILVFDNNTPVIVNGTAQAPEKVTKNKEDGSTKATYAYKLVMKPGTDVITIGKAIRWTLNVAADNAPSANIIAATPDQKKPDVLTLKFTEKDDYGVRQSVLTITPAGKKDPNAKPLPSAKIPPVRLH